MRNLYLVAALCSSLIVSACTSEPSEELQKSIVESTAISNFDPANGVIPFPNDLLFVGSLDKTINIPVADPMDASDPQVALNALDGFSTVAPMTTGFTGPILASSIDGDSVRLYQVILTSNPEPGGAVVNINQQLVYGVDYVATVSSVDSSGSTLVILPLKPLAPRSSYFVVITNSLQSTDGSPMGASGAYTFARLTTPLEVGGVSQFPALTDAQAVALEPLRQLVSFSVNQLLLFDTSLGAGDLVMSWSFTTQSVGDVLLETRTNAPTPASTLAAATVDLGSGAGRTPLGAANLFVGTLDSIPYYLTAPSIADPTAILTKPWQATVTVDGENNLTWDNPIPASTGPIDVPLMVATPANTIVFPPPWKTVIYQHGITRNRADMLAVADTLASFGFATVAIDIPLHGLNASSPFYQGGAERTFDVDLVGQDGSGNIVSSGPDGTPDSSGLHFINLNNLLMSRDNLRQSVADLFALRKGIPGIDVVTPAGAGVFLPGPDGTPDLSATEVYFVGHSMGAIVGTAFANLEPTLKDVVLANGGGGIPKILDGSASFSPIIVAGLAAAGVAKGTADYEAFLGAAQAVVDAADPLNHAADLATKTQGVLFFEVVGGNASPSDLTVPNTVPDGNDSSNTVPAPLAGTEPLLSVLGLTQINTTTAGTDLKVSVKFTAGSHGSILDPSSSAAVTSAMQGQMASFLANDGNSVTVSDPGSVIRAP
ncbi:MAG: hypothetical protein OEO19_15675 [Gammaproteobacteria bacterium]|nr:hypothetical protein [Gammaproteobacteria bacterium]MDH3448441.1 hypothetical protein [Gammaproteobacteria bacterium]